MYIAAFDVGTTAVKGLLMDEVGQVAAVCSMELPTIYEGDHKEQDPRTWWEAFRTISLEFTRTVSPEEIAAVGMSGQMQNLIPLDEHLESVCSAILYSDGRAVEQAARLEAAVGAGRFLERTGNRCDGSLPLPKLMWLREERPDLYARTAHILISAKDYLIARLTGVCCGDRTACSTAGAMEISRTCWDRELLDAAGVDSRLFPKLLAPHAKVGTVLPDSGCGYLPGTAVFAGIGDAGATTLASGISRPGQYNINLGTSGWVATVSRSVLRTESGVFNLAAAAEGHYINVVPFLNAGGVHKWASGILGGYDNVSALLTDSVPGSHGVLFLPYLAGERFPVLDPDIRGGFVGLTPQTNSADLARACLEGVAYSIRQGLEQFPDAPEELSLIGGGGRETAWCQILADVLGRKIAVFRDAEYLPTAAAAAVALLGLGKLRSYDDLSEILHSHANRTRYFPRSEEAALYEKQYLRFCGLYPALRSLV